MAEFGSGVDEFELDGLVGLARCVHEQRLCEGIKMCTHLMNLKLTLYFDSKLDDLSAPCEVSYYKLPVRCKIRF